MTVVKNGGDNSPHLTKDKLVQNDYHGYLLVEMIASYLYCNYSTDKCPNCESNPLKIDTSLTMKI